MRTLISGWIRIPVIFLIIVGIMEFSLDSGGNFAFIEFPVLQLVLLMVLMFLIAAELILNAIENVMFKTLSEEAKERYMTARQQRLKKYSVKSFFQKMTASKPISEERDIELDHNYDGIKELDNNLPPWWLYSFYVSIVFAFGYMFYYHIFDGDNQLTEYENEMAAAALALEEYKENATDLLDAGNVTVLTDPTDIEAGNDLFQSNCMACHSADGGGGIGPNLTDDYWISGGGIQNIFHVISEGGRAGKGMIAWKSTLKPVEIQQISSYILTLAGTNPENPKEPEGEIWKGGE